MIFPRDRLLFCCFYFAIAASVAFAPTSYGSEDASLRALKSVWQRHSQETSDHQRIINVCLRFKDVFPESAFIPLVETLAGWHYLQQGKWGDARQMYENRLADENPDLLAKSARQMARRWLTRPRHKELRSGLNSYYEEHIQFPEKLSLLKSLSGFDEEILTDAFDQPWRYEPQSIALFATGTPQNYALSSPVLEETSSLDEFLNAVYGGDRVLKAAERLDSSGNARDVLKFRTSEGDSPIMTPGGNHRNTEYVRRVRGLVILSTGNGDFWDIMEIEGH